MKKLFNNLFSGRIRRREYILGLIVNVVFCVILEFLLISLIQWMIFVFVYLFGASSSHSSDIFVGVLAAIGVGLPGIISLVVFLSLVIRRFHDLNKSGWYALLFLVPIVNIFIPFYLILAGGYKLSNGFGQPANDSIWKSILGIKKEII